MQKNIAKLPDVLPGRPATQLAGVPAGSFDEGADLLATGKPSGAASGAKPGGKTAPSTVAAADPKSLPATVIDNESKHELLVKNQQKVLTEAIEQAPPAEKAAVAGRVLHQQGMDYQALSHDTLSQIPSTRADKNVSIGEGLGSRIDDVVSNGQKTAYVESKLTIQDVNERTINQLKNATQVSKPEDIIILNVARKPTAKELQTLESLLGAEVYKKIKIVSSQSDLFNTVQTALQ